MVNCNLQRLDGPVRGNGSIVQELERLFAGAGWNVIKLLWGSDWDDLFARDSDNAIQRRLREVVDGELQSYGANDAGFNRQRFFNKYPELQQLVSHLSDAEIDNLKRGGHDPLKIHAAFDAAVRCRGVPTVVLAQTKKGYGLGRWAQGRMAAHQHKKLSDEELRSFRDRFDLPLSEQQILDAEFYRPPADSPEMRYLHQCRKRLGGYLPARTSDAPQLTPPKASDFGDFTLKPSGREMSTTVAFVRMLAALLKNEAIGKRIVPIVADEARTFGMESLFRQAGLYSHCGQLYEPEDRSSLLSYRESRDGQILEEGINEAGALASWIAAGTSYSCHAVPMLPFYVFYSVFGFQRVGDLILAGADSRARGFLIGATSGRTTLSGEGLQHQDGSSHLLASTIPSCRAYDPCFAYELAVIVEQGMRAMLQRQEDVFYYVTVMNEAYLHPSLPAGAEEGILKGMHLARRGVMRKARVQLLGSGAILREALAAADILEQDWDVTADVWSVTSFSELRRAGLKTERWNRLHPTKAPRLSWVEECLNSTMGPVVAATDYVRAIPDLIRTWAPRRYITLGTDGFGRSDTRAALRRFFEVDRTAIAHAALSGLVEEGTLDPSCLAKFRKRYQYAPPLSAPWDA